MDREECERCLEDISSRYDALLGTRPATEHEAELSEWVETLRDALRASLLREKAAPCESCGEPSVGRSLDDVPLCETCGRALESE
jgi:formylmethanofuran dehydrogenase subunit E